MDNNAKFSATNKELVAVVKKLSNKNKDIQRETFRLKKKAAAGQHKGRGTQPCVSIPKIKAIMSLMHVLN